MWDTTEDKLFVFMEQKIFWGKIKFHPTHFGYKTSELYN